MYRAIAVVGALTIVSCCETRNHATNELSVRRAYACINGVRRSRAGEVVGVVSVEKQVPLMNGIETPRCAGLGRWGSDLAILLDECDTGSVVSFAACFSDIRT